jgi:hypothetical protein
MALGLLAASCDSGGSGSKSSSTTKPPSTTGVTQAGAEPVGPEAAVAKYLASQNIEYAGDCAIAKLPRDKGKWCSTLRSGADNPDQKVYDVGPVGSKPEKVLTVNRHGKATLTPGNQVGVQNGNVGQPQQLTYAEIAGNAFISGNLLLDQQAGIGKGLADLPGGQTSPPPTTGGGGGGGGNPPPTTQPPYPPNGGGVVENPTVPVGNDVVFRGSGCGANEQLVVLIDGKPSGTITSGPDGTFAGSITIPPGTAPGIHSLTVQGQHCVFNSTIIVQGNLAFTGSSSHTSTYVLGGMTAVIIGSILVVGSRRRRRTIGRPPTGSPPSPA